MANQAVTVADIVVHLRDAIVAARDGEDRDELTKLAYAVGMMLTLAEGSSDENYYDRELVAVVENLKYAIDDWFYDVPFKSTIPSAEEIRAYLERRDGSRPRWAY